MASMPPNTPPGNPPGRPPGPPYGPPQGVPYQPYGNAKDYWRYQKEQNKAAWRAQRDMWRAQRDAMRANRSPSVAGPVILILVGIIALLLITHRIEADHFWEWFGRWWPILLISIGVIALAEWAIDLRRENPPARRFGGYVWLVILVVVLGLTAGSHRYWGPWQAEWGDNGGNDNFNPFREPEHDFDQPVVNTAIPANAQIEIQNARGDVSIAASDEATMDVKAHQVAFAGKDEEANKIFASQKPQVTVTGTAVLVKVEGNSSGRTNLSLSVPKSASVNVNTGHGSVTVAGLNGNVDAQVQHGNLEVASINGHVHAHIANQGDVSAHDVQGDVTIDGNGGDMTLSDIHGAVTMQGDYTGDTHLEHADQSVHFHTSRTDLEFGRLPGDMSINGDALHATQVIGPVRVICSRSKDIEMSQVFGDTHIEDKDARVELYMGGAYAVEVKNNKGDVEVALPESVGATVEARTHNGDIVSDFPLQISGDENKSATGTIGKGGPRLMLTTEHADVRIRKSGEAPAVPAAPTTPKAGAAPKAPPAPGVPHLRAAPKAAPAEPVSQ